MEHYQFVFLVGVAAIVLARSYSLVYNKAFGFQGFAGINRGAALLMFVLFAIIFAVDTPRQQQMKFWLIESSVWLILFAALWVEIYCHKHTKRSG